MRSPQFDALARSTASGLSGASPWRRLARGVAVLLALLAAPALAPTAAAAPPARGAVLATSDFELPGVVAELTEATRRDGVLTVKVRFRNTGDAFQSRMVYASSRDIDKDFYVTAGGKKYFVLRDTEGKPLTPDSLHVSVTKNGGTTNWWAKFPAPPATVTSFSLSMSRAAPFDGVPITDAQ